MLQKLLPEKKFCMEQIEIQAKLDTHASSFVKIAWYAMFSY